MFVAKLFAMHCWPFSVMNTGTPMIFKSLLVFCTVTPVLADTLASGSVFFDSRQTYEEVVDLSSKHDNEGIAKLITDRHISAPITNDEEIQILNTGPVLSEFRFLDDPTTYWAISRYVIKTALVEAPSPTPEPSATPSPTPHPVNPEPRHRVKPPAPLDDEHGLKVWHQVDGAWKWYYRDGKGPEHRLTVRRALPVMPP
jgi:hypothetical protein